MGGKIKSYLTILLLCCAAALLLGYIGVQNTVSKQNIATLEGGWSFSVNGTQADVQPGDTLSAYIFPTVLKGDEVTLSRSFSEMDEPYRMLAFDTWHCVTEVSLNGRALYTWGENYAQNGQMLGAMRHLVPLPDTYSGGTLTITLTATEDNPLPYLTSVAYYAADDPSILWFNRPPSLLFLGAFFIFLGIIIAFIACTFVTYRHVSFEQLMLGLCVVMTGIYILARGNFISLLIPDPLLYNAIEYVSLFLLPVPLLLYWLEPALACRYLAVRASYYICLTLNCLFILSAIPLNFTTGIHLCQLLPLYYVLVLLVVIIVFVLIYFQDRTADVLRKKAHILGIGAFIVGSILSIVAFRLCYNPFIANTFQLFKWYNYILPASMCTFVVFLSLSFILDMKLLLENNFRHDFLQYAAYSDVLTQLFNRRSFNEDMERLDEAQNTRTYGIISIDVNDLKHINDTLGHSAGDRMLESFSKLLTAVCGETVKAYRLGGDEFAAVVTEQPATRCADIQTKLQSAVDEFNRAESHAFHLSAAYGVATSEEAHAFSAVLELADQRMYQKKKEMKVRGGIADDLSRP